jgi:hypothetical protein
MTPAIFITAAGVLCAILVAVGGAVWRLAKRVGEGNVLTDNATKALAGAAGAFKEINDRLDEHESQIALLKSQWHNERETAHRTALKLTEIVERLGRMEAVCRERRERSRRLVIRESHDAGVVEEIEPVSCPLTAEEE